MTVNEIIAQDEMYYMPTYGKRFPLIIDHGDGCYLYDNNNKQYIDFTSGIATNCLGYANKKFEQTMQQQLSKICHCSNLYYNEQQTKLAKNLCNLMGNDYKCFFANSGAEANECAIKLVRKHFPQKHKILTLTNSFHGRTMATLTATGQPKFHKNFMPLCPSFDYFSNIDELTSKIDDTTGGIMIELVQGEGGVNPLSKEFVSQIDDLCKKHNILLIVDEIQTGMGRTGKMFAFNHYNISPDIITLAKSLGNGIPIGACLAKSNISFDKGDHGTTFGGNPFACCAGNFVVESLNPQMLQSINENSQYIMEKLKDYNPRGYGLLIGFTVDDLTNIDIVNKCLEKGLLIVTAGLNTVRLLPPYIVSKPIIDQAINIINTSINELRSK